jgi:hypothetical protein
MLKGAERAGPRGDLTACRFGGGFGFDCALDD